MKRFRAKQAPLTGHFVIQELVGEQGYRPVYRGPSVLTAANKEQANELVKSLESGNGYAQ